MKVVCKDARHEKVVYQAKFTKAGIPQDQRKKISV